MRGYTSVDIKSSNGTVLPVVIFVVPFFYFSFLREVLYFLLLLPFFSVRTLNVYEINVSALCFSYLENEFDKCRRYFDANCSVIPQSGKAATLQNIAHAFPHHGQDGLNFCLGDSTRYLFI